MNLNEMVNFLNKNECLSEDWKNELLSLISDKPKDANDKPEDTDNWYNELKDMIIRHEGKSYTMYRWPKELVKIMKEQYRRI